MVPKGPRLITIWVCLKLYGTSLRPWVHQCSPWYSRRKNSHLGVYPIFNQKGTSINMYVLEQGYPMVPQLSDPYVWDGGMHLWCLFFFIFRTEIAIWRYPQFSVLFIYIYIFVQNIWGSWYCSPCASATMYSIVWLLGLVMMRRMIHAFWGCEEEWCSVCFRAIHIWVCLIPSHT